MNDHLQSMADRLFAKSASPAAVAPTFVSAVPAPVKAEPAAAPAPAPAPTADAPSSMAARLYPTSKHEPLEPVVEDEQPRVPKTDAELAQVLYGDKPVLEFERPAEIDELRATTERRLFDNSIHLDIANAIPRSDEDGNEFAPAYRKAVALELSRMARDLDLDHGEVAQVMRTASEYSKVERTVDVVKARQLSASQMLVKEFGVERANEALRAGQALVRRDKRVATWLQNSGMGDDPTTVITICKKAMAAKSRRAAS